MLIIYDRVPTVNNNIVLTYEKYIKMIKLLGLTYVYGWASGYGTTSLDSRRPWAPPLKI